MSAAGLMNARFLAMGIALAPSLPGRAASRAAQGQAVVDSSWAMANRRDGSFDRWLLFGATLPQYLTWVLGTTTGAFAGDLLGDVERFGLDAVYPTFFLGLVIAELKDAKSRLTALVGAGDRPGARAADPARRTDPGCGVRRADRPDPLRRPAMTPQAPRGAVEPHALRGGDG